MAAKNTTSDDDMPIVAAASDDTASGYGSYQDDNQIPEETGLDEDSGFYTMGDIKVDEAEDNSQEEFKKASKALKPEDEDEEEEWVDDDDVNLNDKDDFLDEEGIDFENYEYEKDDY